MIRVSNLDQYVINFQVWCRETFRLIAGCMGICALTLSYAAFGGFMFMAVENSIDTTSSSIVTYYTTTQSKSDYIVSVEPVAAVSSSNFATAALFSSKNTSIMDLERSNKEIDKARLSTVKKLWEITEQMNILYPENWTRIAAQELATFQDIMVKVLVSEWQKAYRLTPSQSKNKNKYSMSRNSQHREIQTSNMVSSKSSSTARSRAKNVMNKEKNQESKDGKAGPKMG